MLEEQSQPSRSLAEALAPYLGAKDDRSDKVAWMTDHKKTSKALGSKLNRSTTGDRHDYETQPPKLSVGNGRRRACRGIPMSGARAADKLKIGIVYVSPMADIGWTKQHALGVEAIKQAMGD